MTAAPSPPDEPARAPARTGAPPASRRGVAARHPSARPWSNVVVPVCLLLLLAGFAGVLYTGRARGGFTRLPTVAEKRIALCRDHLTGVALTWRSSGTIPASLARGWGGVDGLACPNDDGVPYVLRDLARFPVDASRATDEPIAACLGLCSTTERWRPPHGDVVLVAFADGEVRELTWSDLGLDGDPAPWTRIVVGPDAPSPLLRTMTLGR